MKALHCRLLIVALAFAPDGLTCVAQNLSLLRLPAYQSSIDFTQTGVKEFSDFHFSPRATGTMVAPTYPATAPRVGATKFLLVNGLHLGMAIFDIEMTQRCIASHRCYETNPLMPSSQSGQLSINLAIVGGVTWISYWARKSGSRFWWLPPAAGAAIHSGGVVTGFQHQ